jgi:hypothetical protein
MKYMLMLFEEDTDWLSVSKETLDAELGAHDRFIKSLQERGISFTAAALRPWSTATTLRPDGDDVIVTDGPYVELKQNLGGYYLIDAEDLDEVLEIAKRCPMGTGIEIRPTWDTSS